MQEPNGLPNRAVLEIPADTNFVQLARLVASGIAGRLDFDVDEIEDLRIGVDECCVALIDCAVADQSLSLTYSWNDDAVALEGHVGSAPGAGEPGVHGITGQILAAVVDHVQFGNSDGQLFFRLHKRRGARA